ncbi:MAG: glycosyltransferase [Candidatus Omnitrophica bacterium]|nr:glycosyltransferase [Candidatus Omnitrophota bacterium]
MKVLLLTTHLNTGGVAMYTANLARYLKKEGVDVQVASSGGEVLPRLEDPSIEHNTLDIRTKNEFGIKVWKAAPSLARIISSGGFDIVHTQTRVTHVLACLVRHLRETNHVTTCHGFYNSRRIGRRIFPCWGDRVIAISKSVRQHLLEDFNIDRDKIEMVYNGIELDKYLRTDPGNAKSVLKDRIGLSKDAFVVGSVARLSPVKGQGYLIEAFAKAQAKRPGMRLLLVGEGPDEKMLREKARREGLKDKVLFASGRQMSLEEYLSVMDVFCLASISEGLGLSLMEAMASGRACIASDVGGLSELIQTGKNGLLVPSRDVDALSEAVTTLALDERQRLSLSRNARKKALEEFGIEKSVRKTIEVYRSVLER